MSRMQALIDSFHDLYGSTGIRAVRDASRSIRITVDDDGRLLATVDGEERYRTNREWGGVWAWSEQRHVAERGLDGAWRPAHEWKQVVGTCQISGRTAFRLYVVEVEAQRRLYA